MRIRRKNKNGAVVTTRDKKQEKKRMTAYSNAFGKILAKR